MMRYKSTIALLIATSTLALASCASAPEPEPYTTAPETAGPGSETAAPLPTNPNVEPCDIGELKVFDWPPPEPSTKVSIPRGLLLLGIPEEDKTLGTVAQRLEAALVDAGYVEFGYQATDCAGFALVTRMEQIDDEGKPLQGTARFEPPSDEAPWSLGGFIRQLIGAPPGYYRQIVFVATTRPYEAENLAPPPSREDLDQMVENADAQALPESMAAEPYTPAHKLHVLIYEFEKRRDEDPMQLMPSRLAGVTHVEAAGIYDGLSE
ncbi:MAG: hypothetical protein MRY64_13185 [Hyphomonadaceae bacterium]|nr:hypothetical protein [Hyphomonadaceae bacterium]